MTFRDLHEVRQAVVDVWVGEALRPLAETIEEWEVLSSHGLERADAGWTWTGSIALSDCRSGDDWFQGAAADDVAAIDADIRLWHVDFVKGDDFLNTIPKDERSAYADALWEKHTGADQDPAQLWLPGIEPVQTWENQACQEAWDFSESCWQEDENKVDVVIAADYENRRVDMDRDTENCVVFRLKIGGRSWTVNWERIVALRKLRPTTPRAAAKLIERMLIAA